MSSDTLVIVGTLGRPRGVQGEMYITPETDFPERFIDLKEIYVGSQKSWERFAIASCRMVSGRPVIRFADVTTPEQAARLTNRQLAIPKSEVLALPADTFYIHDLIGCQVVDAVSGRSVGEVVQVERFPASDVYVINTDTGREVRCPAVTQFVKEINIEEKRISVVTVGWLEDENS